MISKKIGIVESIVDQNGELDDKAMENLIKDKKLWEVLAEESNS